MNPTEKNAKDKVVAGLREIADTLEANPDLRAPYIGSCVMRVTTVAEMREAARCYGGTFEKSTDDSSYNLKRHIAPNLSILIYAQHEDVCERIVLGKRTVGEVILPARAETIVPAHEEEIVKWHCPDVLSAGGRVEESRVMA